MSTAVMEGDIGCSPLAPTSPHAFHHGGPSPDVVSDLELPSLSHYEPPHTLLPLQVTLTEEDLSTENRLRYSEKLTPVRFINYRRKRRTKRISRDFREQPKSVPTKLRTRRKRK